MTTQQPEALRLADCIDPIVRLHAPDHLTSKVAADELRRQHARIVELEAQIAAAQQADPFMWAIKEPGGSAYIDENCVSTSRGIVEAEVDGLNLPLGADDEPYKVVPVYLAATQPADVAPAQEVQAAIDRFDAYFRSANGVPPNARVTVPTAEWQELRTMLSTPPTQQGMGQDAARYRWLREQKPDVWKRIGWTTWPVDQNVMDTRDDEIDQALAAQAKQG